MLRDLSQRHFQGYKTNERLENIDIYFLEKKKSEVSTVRGRKISSALEEKRSPFQVDQPVGKAEAVLVIHPHDIFLLKTSVAECLSGCYSG